MKLKQDNSSFKSFLISFKWSIYKFLFLGAFIFILRYTNEGLYTTVFYYLDWEVFLNDSTSYMIRGLIIMIPLLFLLMIQLSLTLLTKKWTYSIVFLSIILILGLSLNSIANTVLSSEIQDINYQRYFNELQNQTKERKAYIASLLRDDCKILVKELNIEKMLFQTNSNESIFDLGKCENLNLHSKKLLLNYLEDEKLIIYTK